MQVDQCEISLPEGPFADFRLWHKVLEYVSMHDIVSISQVRKPKEKRYGFDRMLELHANCATEAHNLPRNCNETLSAGFQPATRAVAVPDE